MMYEPYWGLTEKPFKNTFKSKFFFFTLQHHDALNKLKYCIQEGLGAGLLTGIFGCGKTYISRLIISHLITERFQSIFITHPPATSLELLISICSELGDKQIIEKVGATSFAESAVWNSLKTQVYNNYLNGKDTVIVIDEAHLINDTPIFETIRLLLNIQEENKFLISILLIGHPELEDKIENLKALEQRIAVKARLGSLNEDEVGNYITHRLKVAGRPEPIFTNEAVRFIYAATGGIPRRINRLCDLALLYGFTHKIEKIDLGVLQTQAMGISLKVNDKHDEGIFTAKSLFVPQGQKFEAKDVENIYNNGLLLTENILTRAEKQEPPDIKFTISIVSQFMERLKAQDTTLLSLAYKNNSRDYLRNHLLGVCVFSLLVGLEAGLSEASLIDLGLSAILHDLGLLSLRHIIQLPRKLNQDEYKSVKAHPVLTAEFLDKFKDINQKVKENILSHHERINGQGYPQGLKGDEISLEAKILAVADVWETLTHKRAWRDKFKPTDAIFMLRDYTESSFDAKIVKILVDKLSIYPIGSLVRLNNIEVGEVVFAEKGFPTKLKIILDSEGKPLAEPKLISMSSYPNLFIMQPVIA